MRFAVSFIVVAVVTGMSASGQEQKKERPKFEPRSEPGAGQTFLKRF